jgi:hypothetical protein
VQVLEVAGIAFDVPPTSKWLPSCKRAKKDQKASKIAENNSISAQVRAIADMAVATLEWTTIMWNQSMMAVFSMFDDQL